MLKENELVGTISVYRQEVRPFTDKQIELVSNFAKQAVIAIENTRLLNELRQRTDDLGEALEQQTATSDVLQVISSSPGELEPVFQSMLANATRICEAKIGILFRYEDGTYTAVAKLGVTPAYAEYLDRGPIRPGATTGLGRVASTRQTIHIVDTHAEQAYADREPFRVATAELGGARSLLNVPMLKEGKLIGAIGIYRQEVRPFTDKQVELVTNFAAQAVIAIENTRLLNELRSAPTICESLEQQTATSEVLQVISSSPGELQPVFDAMLENATRVCEAKFGSVPVSTEGAARPVALHGVPPAYAEFVAARAVIAQAGAALRSARRQNEADRACRRFQTEQAYVERNPFSVAGVELARHPYASRGPDAQGERADRRYRHLPPGGAAVHRQADRAGHRTSPPRPSSPSRTRGCSTSCANRCSSRPPPPTCSKSSAARPSICRSVLDTLVESAARLCEADMAHHRARRTMASFAGSELRHVARAHAN